MWCHIKSIIIRQSRIVNSQGKSPTEEYIITEIINLILQIAEK